MSPALTRGGYSGVVAGLLSTASQAALGGSREERPVTSPAPRVVLSRHLTTVIITCQCPAPIILSDC